MSRVSTIAKGLVAIVVMAASAVAWAAPPADVAPSSPAHPPHAWSVESELVQPLVPNVGILRLRVTRGLWRSEGGLRGDLVVGAYARPNVRHDIVERINEYMGTVGYRQYVWKGAHVEGLVNAGAAWGTNRFDGMRYDTPSVFVEANLGYRFDLRKAARIGWFVTPQVGVIASVGVADIGPRNGKPDTFPQAGLLVGASW